MPDSRLAATLEVQPISIVRLFDRLRDHGLGKRGRIRVVDGPTCIYLLRKGATRSRASLRS